MSHNPLTGASYLARGFSMLPDRQIRPFVIVPLIVNVLLFSLAVYGLFAWLPGWVASWLASWPDFLAWLDFILYPLMVLSCALIIYFTFGLVANLIAAPFNGLLAERVEQQLTGRRDDGGGWAELASIVPQALGREFAKLLYYLPRLLILFIICLIPGINLLAPIIWFVFGAWMQSVQYGDYPMDNNKVSFKAMLKLLAKRCAVSLGFGATVQLGMMVPLLNLLIMPAAVIGATIYWADDLSSRVETEA